MRRAGAPTREEIEVTVDALGDGGDGLAMAGGRRLYIPYSLPGERLRVRLGAPRGQGREAAILARLGDAPERAEPPCPHFGQCGGCALQHMAGSAYAAWKQGRVVRALVRRGLVAARIDAMVVTGPGTRRRARFAAIGTALGAVLGFNRRQSRQIVGIETCPLLTPPLQALLPSLGSLASDLLAPGAKADMEVLDLSGALDVLIVADGRPDLAQLERLAAYAGDAGLRRLSWQSGERATPEPIVRHGPLVAVFAGIAVALPPGAFLQPSLAGEAALQGFVMEELRDARRIVELYAGCGTFSLPLAARGARVLAVEGNAAMVAALLEAAPTAALAGRLCVERRDLARRPLAAAEFLGADAILLNPPRGGAEPQVRQLGEATQPIVYVSCNPASFARDARHLVGAGYRLARVMPVDQFHWSPHAELAALFSR